MFPKAWSGGNGFTGQGNVGFGNKSFPVRVERSWDGIPTKSAASPSLGVSQTGLEQPGIVEIVEIVENCGNCGTGCIFRPFHESFPTRTAP